MQNRRLDVLLVDDDPDDYVIVRDLLSEIEGLEVNLDWESSYEAGLEAIEREQHQVYLLDYRLGQRDGLELLKQAIKNGCKAPMIPSTGQGERAVDLEAMNAGADDYLLKDRVDSTTLERSIRYALERRRLLMEIEQRERELEVRSLEQLSQPQATEVASQLVGNAPLRETLPDIFEELVGRYWNLLEIVLEGEPSDEGYDVRRELGEIGQQLGSLNVGPSDVVAIHADAFKQKIRDAKPQKAQAYIRESRLLIIELLSNLVTFYRNLSMGIQPAAASSGRQQPKD